MQRVLAHFSLETESRALPLIRLMFVDGSCRPAMSMRTLALEFLRLDWRYYESLGGSTDVLATRKASGLFGSCHHLTRMVCGNHGYGLAWTFLFPSSPQIGGGEMAASMLLLPCLTTSLHASV